MFSFFKTTSLCHDVKVYGARLDFVSIYGLGLTDIQVKILLKFTYFVEKLDKRGFYETAVFQTVVALTRFGSSLK